MGGNPAEVRDLLKFGFVFMATGFMAMGVAYLVRIFVLRNGEEAAGFYQSAYTLGGLTLASFCKQWARISSRLTAVAQDNSHVTAWSTNRPKSAC